MAHTFDVAGLGNAIVDVLAPVSEQFLLDHSIAAEVNDALPARAPSFFFVDIQKDQTDAFDKTIAASHGSQIVDTTIGRNCVIWASVLESSEVEDDVRLLWVLRDLLGVNGPKYGCGLDVCKACTCLINGKAASVCSVKISCCSATAAATSD